MTTKFLATTALDEFWDKTQPILFLGEWCKSYKNKSVWENLNYETLDAPLSNQDPFENLNYIEKIYKEILPLIAQWLNKIHQCKHSLEYWEIILGSFLFTHIQTVYDRYSRLNVAYLLYPNLITIGLAETSFMTPLNTGEYYISSMMSDAFNLQLMTQIISFAFNKPNFYKDYSREFEKNERKRNIQNSHPRLRTKIQIFFSWVIIKLCGKKTVAVIAAHGFNKSTLYKLMWSSKFKILPVMPKKQAISDSLKLLNTKPDLVLRTSFLNLPAENNFSKLILQLLVTHMPLSFIENYQQECRISKIQYPFFAKVVFGAPPIGAESLKLWIARNRNKGVKQVGWQHGAGYGTLKFYSIEFVEHKFSDLFVAWGMKNDRKVIAAPSVPICLQLEEKIKKGRIVCKNGCILWVTTQFMRYPFAEIRFCIRANQDEKLYYHRQSRILELLNPGIFSQVIMRLRYTDWSDNWKYVSDRFSKLKLHQPSERSSFYDQIWSAKLLFFDNFNTTHYYGLVLNIPTILCWNEKNCGIKDELKFYFDALRDAGIYHDTPESAAAMINEIGDDPLPWWNKEDVQSARQQYCDFFTQTSDDWVDRWKNILLSLRDYTEINADLYST